MNRVIIINLNGIAYQLEENGYDALRTYLDNASRRLEGNPDQAEIIADIEQAIADKFRAVLGANKNVVMTKEVESALAEMGPVQDGTTEDASTNPGKSAGPGDGSNRGNANAQADREKSPGAIRRLYTISEGAMFFGVCNGLAAFWKIDVTLVRILFVCLTLMWGMGFLIYLIMAFIIPSAETPSEKAAAFGASATAQEFIRRAKDGYYEGMKSLNDREARREWKRKFKRDMRGWGHKFQYDMQRWQQHWSSQHPRHGVGPAFAAPFFSLLGLAITLIAVFAIYSLVTGGVVFGIGLPTGVPLWVGVVFLLVIWRCVAWPLKAMRWHACYGGHYPHGGPFGGFGDFIGGVAMIVLMVWLADHYIPQFHEALKQLPPLLHRAIDSLQGWLEKR